MVASVSTPLDPTNMSAGTTTYEFPGATSASYSQGTDGSHATGNFNVTYPGQSSTLLNVFGSPYGSYGAYGIPLTPAQQKAGQAAATEAMNGQPINYATLTPQQLLPVMLNSYQTAYNEAKQTNLNRYDQILQGYQDRYAQAQKDMGALPDNWGDAQQALLNQQFGVTQSKADQQLADLGMSNTTVQPSVDAGIALQHGLASNSLADQIAMTKAQFANQRASMNAANSADTLNFMNSRQDPYPDPNTPLSIAQMMGQGSLNGLQGLLGAYGGMGGGGMGGYGGGGMGGLGGSAYGGFAGSGFSLPNFGTYLSNGGPSYQQLARDAASTATFAGMNQQQQQQAAANAPIPLNAAGAAAWAGIPQFQFGNMGVAGQDLPDPNAVLNSA